MGAVFAVQVRTGFETKAKDMLKYVFTNHRVDLVRGIFANETHTEFISDKTNNVSDEFIVTEEDIANHLQKERILSAINNRRQQLDIVNRYNDEEYESIKIAYRKEIRELEKQVQSIRGKSKAIHSVLSGYILIELELNSTYLPNELWHMIKSVPYVQSILSTDPIPEDEINRFFDRIGEITEPEVNITFEKEKTYDEIKKEQEELLIEINKENSNVNETEKLEEELDNLHLNIVDKVVSYINNKPVNDYLSKIKAFIKRNRKTVTMPKSIFCELYGEDERTRISRFLSSKDFIDRFNKLIGKSDGVVYG